MIRAASAASPTSIRAHCSSFVVGGCRPEGFHYIGTAAAAHRADAAEKAAGAAGTGSAPPAASTPQVRASKIACRTLFAHGASARFSHARDFCSHAARKNECS
ncbi:hypothetical protein EON67_09750 [archaeon]|nr:MAG: hypothetical protein EON67_09750 [archaeon]